ncbi:alpha-N-arabinofuranosidase [Agromyces flavus]|uniref:non-reducing end alpha-L-arabinofuranosidase n=1 Tax=Agromyces flavus TaxID=589382 RepID=A0A1H1VE26_9MICO|nr:alpha-N-arabinofuranosidase [Agromyces flavus]MCP2365903.1 alpha-N-arabinofuranosidase [Agromyces flavus]GGI43611.1 alpha-N-arabinofuranosidase [Agromyces flavus]SDS82666.1 alpha-N-arabinofuranosidase [Agromyces flavus]
MKRAHLTIDPHFVVGRVQRRLFGSFVEHLGRCVYDGIYEPGHPNADPDGYRSDVIELVRELGVSAIRYPGGNFVSGYRWEDGVGPRDERPRRLDLAWHSTETNEVGLDEFASWLRKVGSELMYAVNLGTRGVQEALDVLEYANIRSGTTLSDRRVANGSPEPHDIRMWCLGNEMDGPWQLGHGTAEEYGRLASKTARAMRQVDPELELVACGSSSAHMPTFGHWERTVLEETYDDVDYISCHAYYEPKGGDYGSFLASGVDMDRFIDSVVATADHVKSARGSEKTMYISFDEWNVWYQSRYNEVDRITDVAEWPVAPRLLEDVYSVVDAVVFGSLLISLIRHADRVTSASLAQLVNVIAPIMTEPGGPAWRQTTFFPFSVTSALAKGDTLELKLDCPTYSTALYGEVPLVDAVATYEPATGETAVFLVNRSLDEEVSLEIDTSILDGLTVRSFQTLSDEDIHAVNTLEVQDRVRLRDNDSARTTEGAVTVTLPPVSWSALTLA